MSLTKKLQGLLNSESRGHASDTPDYILAEYMMACLEAYELAVNERDAWHILPHDMMDKIKVE